MKKYSWYLFGVIMFSLVLTNFVMKFFPGQGILLDFVVYCGITLTCTGALMMFDQNFKRYLFGR